MQNATFHEGVGKVETGQEELCNETIVLQNIKDEIKEEEEDNKEPNRIVEENVEREEV